jgi:predicted nucleotidyltransferase
MRSSDLLIVQLILQNILPKNSKVWVFGSRAKGTTKRSSDLDLAIDAGRVLLKAESSALFHAFEESDLPYKVDVADLYTVNETLKMIIDKEKISLPMF